MTGIPKVAMVSRSARRANAVGPRTRRAADADIWVRMISVGQPHRATPITGAICLVGRDSAFPAAFRRN